MHKKKKKVVLIDLDRTLIDTAKIQKDGDTLFLRLGVSRDILASARRSMEGKIFHPDILFKRIQRLAGGRQRAPAMPGEYYDLFSKHEAYNFPGVSPFLKQLSRRYELVLLSYGHEDFQLKKFHQAGLGKFFKKAVITSNLHKKKDLLAFFKVHQDGVLLLDDSMSVILAARNVGMKAILIRRTGKSKAYYQKLQKRIRTALG